VNCKKLASAAPPFVEWRAGKIGISCHFGFASQEEVTCKAYCQKMVPGDEVGDGESLFKAPLILPASIANQAVRPQPAAQLQATKPIDKATKKLALKLTPVIRPSRSTAC
jgi:hypothetical protein